MINRRDRRIKIDESVTRKNALDRNVTEAIAKVFDDGVLAPTGRGQGRVAAFRRDHYLARGI